MAFAFPSELSYNMLANMYPSKKSEYRRQPINTREFQNPGEEVQLVLSKMENSFYDPNTLAVNFVVEYQGTTASTKACILGNGYSHFSRQVWTANKNGAKLETIQNPAELVNCIHNMTIEGNAKDALSLSLGYEDGFGYTNFGRLISNAASRKTQSYSIPLVGIMNNAKLIPAFISDLQLDLTLNQVSNFIVSFADLNAPAAIPTGFIIKKIELVCEALTLEASSMAELLAAYPGLLSLKSESFLYTSSQLNTNDQGVKDITYAHSLNSLTEFIWWCSPTNGVDKSFGGVNPNLGANGWQLIVNSTSYPSQPVKCDRVAECYYQIQKAWGSLYSSSHCGSFTRANFARAINAFGEYLGYSTTMPESTGVGDTNANKFYNVVDLEVINNFKDSLYSGINTKDGTHTFRLNIDTQLGTGGTIHIYSKFDVILNFDYVNGEINVVQ